MIRCRYPPHNKLESSSNSRWESSNAVRQTSNAVIGDPTNRGRHPTTDRCDPTRVPGPATGVPAAQRACQPIAHRVAAIRQRVPAITTRVPAAAHACQPIATAVTPIATRVPAIATRVPVVQQPMIVIQHAYPEGVGKSSAARNWSIAPFCLAPMQ